MNYFIKFITAEEAQKLQQDPRWIGYHRYIEQGIQQPLQGELGLLGQIRYINKESHDKQLKERGYE